MSLAQDTSDGQILEGDYEVTANLCKKVMHFCQASTLLSFIRSDENSDIVVMDSRCADIGFGLSVCNFGILSPGLLSGSVRNKQP